MAFFAMIWSLRLARNDIDFGGKTWDQAQIYELVKLRVATWAKAKWPREYGRTLETSNEPRLGAVFNCVKKTRLKVELMNPAEGSMKFNVDRAANGSLGEDRIGEILRNSQADILAKSGIGREIDLVSVWTEVLNSDSAENGNYGFVVEQRVVEAWLTGSTMGVRGGVAKNIKVDLVNVWEDTNSRRSEVGLGVN
ncbi:Uncharacterized protein TCM_031946 [Theobroma cacao]|uniref:Uncharacterized protein n=1 Tax=Theobroma cacao TaxID=3641 RepID=A0A061F911_THECC|nr:Uncharacterized protein TCM_031946 [Theobroma cacao]